MDTWEPSRPGRGRASGSLGRRIADLRAERNWTQQQLADRLGISRVAVSHLETDLNVAGERTVALLAGCFGMEPHDLVAGTTYPVAKADRLPAVVARWTEVEHQVAMLERDLWWVDRAGVMSGSEADALLHRWESLLSKLADVVLDPDEVKVVAAARLRVADARRA